MSSGKRRLDKVESSLTPKQAILLWMEEAHQHDTMEQYARFLKPGSDSAWPLARLPEQVSAAVKERMKGQPKQVVARKARQAIRDVLFLFHLHQQVNRKFLEEDRHFWTRALLLSTELDALRREQDLQHRMAWGWFRAGMELPYPLDPDTAAAVDAAREHHVFTWESLEEGEDITGWVLDYFVARGKTRLPGGAYSLQEGRPSTTAPSEEEVRALFTDEEDFQRFLAGEDYTYGLADVSDQEFEEKWEAVLQAMKALAASGEVLEGVVVELATVPHARLGEAPLVDGEWVDRYVVALAEWGARLQTNGYQLREPEDSHPLAWYRVVDPDTGSEADSGILEKAWRQTERHLDRFPGRTRDLEGRSYLHFQDYRRWRGRKARGDFESSLRRGLVLDSWNEWVAAEGAVSLGGVKLSRLDSYVHSCQYRTCRDGNELAQEKRRRESLLGHLQGWKPGSRGHYRQRVRDWKELAERFLGELYSLRQAGEAISRRYFEGRQVLFPARAEDFARLVECVEELVEGYNGDFADEGGQQGGIEEEEQQGGHGDGFIDKAGVGQGASPAARRHTEYLVDMARAEALDGIGENQEAVQIMDRHV